MFREFIKLTLCGDEAPIFVEASRIVMVCDVWEESGGSVLGSSVFTKDQDRDRNNRSFIIVRERSKEIVDLLSAGFIRLTHVMESVEVKEAEAQVFVDPSHIAYVEQEAACTAVAVELGPCSRDTPLSVGVKETPEEIFALMGDLVKSPLAKEE